MDKYKVKISPKAYREMGEIYQYISKSLLEPDTATRLADEFDGAILGLDKMPHRGALRKTGKYANRGYRQLFVKNYTIVYRIDEERKLVTIITVRYSGSQF